MTDTDANGGKQETLNPLDGTYTARILTQWLPAIGIISVMVYHALFLYQNALNVPYADDIVDILKFLTDVSQSHDWTNTVGLFFAQINEHRTLSSRVVYYLVYALTGEANFRTLIFVGNMGLPLLLLMLYLPIRQRPGALLMLLPAALILFQLRIFGTSFWSMNAFAFLFVFVYGFASLICLRELSPARFAGAILFAALATFTLASGQLIWLIGIACIVHKVFVVRRAPVAYLPAWLFAAVGVLAVYYIDYQSTHPIEQLLGTLHRNPREVAVFFFISLGRAFSDDGVGLAAGSGVVLLLAVVWSSMRRWRGDDVTLDVFAWYIVLSLFALALGRISGISWAETAGILPANMSVRDAAIIMFFSPRYTVLSVLLLATTTVLLVSQLQGRRTLVINGFVVLLAFAYCVSSYYFSTARLHLQEQLYIMIGGHNSKGYWAFGERSNESSLIVSKAEELGIYHPPRRPLPIPTLTSPTQSKSNLPPSAVKEDKH